MKTTNILNELFADIGEPTLASFQATAELQRSCRLAAGPHTFNLTLDVRLRPQPTITWSHNTDLHFGITRMNYEDYLELINPVWRPIYYQFGAAAYKLARDRMPEYIDQEVTYSVMVPLRQMNGSYCWYNQVARPCQFDENGRMVAHLNTYHRVAPYARLQPGQPIVTINERQQPLFEREIQIAGSKALTGLLFNGLRPREFEVLYHYRCHAYRPKTAGTPLNSQKLADKMKIKIHGINKHNTRILTAARPAFPAARFTTVMELAEFLNTLFGPPAKP